MLRTTLSALLLLLMSTMRSQTSFQKFLEFSPVDSAYIVALIPSTDGAIIAVFPSGPEAYVLRRFGADGQHEWSKRLQSPAFRNQWAGNGTVPPSNEWYGLWAPFTTDGNGGVLFAYTTVPETYADGNGLDTSITHTTIMRVGSDGTVSAFNDLRQTLIMPADSLFPLFGPQHVQSAIAANGDLLVLEQYMSYWTGATTMTQLTRLSSTDQVEWAHWYHAPGSPDTQGPVGDQGQLCWLLGDTASGTFLVDVLQNRVAHFNVQGTCEWVKRYTYGGLPFPGSAHPTLDRNTNELVIADDVGSWTQRKQLIVRISTSGVLEAAAVFDYSEDNNYLSYVEKTGLLADGGLVIAENAYGANEAFTWVEPGGQVAHHHAPVTGADPAFSFVQDWNIFAAADDHLVAAGQCTVVNNSLGTGVLRCMLASFPPDELGGCLRASSSVNMVDGLQVCTTLNDPTWIDTPPGQETALLALPPPVVVNANPPAVVDMCSVDIGVGEPDDPPLVDVRPTLLQAGEELRVQVKDPVTLLLIATDGRTLRHVQLRSGMNIISTAGLVPAAYLLHCADTRSGSASWVRIIIH
jgi:hypothetical protein